MDERKDKIVEFPATLAERDKLRKERLEAERHIDDGAPSKPPSPPFFNFGHIPPFTKTIITALIAVHGFLWLFAAPSDIFFLYATLGFVPGYFTGVEPMPSLLAWISPLSHVLLHGGWMHLTFNAVMGLALGIFIERRFGTLRAALFFFACALGGAALTLALVPFSTVPIIGASGAISGQFGAILLFFQKEQNAKGMPARFGPLPVLGFWLVFMLTTGAMGGGIAWQAHIGGFLTGIALYLWLNRSKARQ